jgi:glycosyltransferase involved in cell wall biosynthesis
MKIELIYLGRRGAGGPISIELARNLARLTPTQAVINYAVENFDLWRQLNLDYFAVITYSSVISALSVLTFQRHIKELARQIAAEKPDVLLFPMFHPWNAFLQDLLPSIPSVVIVHDLIPHPGIRDYIYSLLESRSFHRAARVITFSHNQIPALIRRGVNPEKIEPVHHGIFTYYEEFYPAAASKAGFNEACVLFFGRVTFYKGLDILLRAFRSVQARFPKAQLTIAGQGDLRPYTRLIRDLQNVKILNRWIEESEVSTIFQNASIVVLPYVEASQSGVIPIAAAFALPVIATNVGSLPEQIDHGKTGILVPPESPEALADAIVGLLFDPAAARCLGQNLKTTYQSERNWEIISRQIYGICEKVNREKN